MAPLTSLESLTGVVLMTALMWMPYICDQMYCNGRPRLLFLDGFWAKVQYDDENKMPAPMHPWGARAAAAHRNAVENLVLFAPLVFLCQSAGRVVDADLPAFIYLIARIAHWPLTILGPNLPTGRTIAFGLGWFACLWMVALVIRHQHM